MAEKRLQSLDVWTDVVSNSGTNQSTFVEVFAAEHIESLDTGSGARDRARFTVDPAEAAWSDVIQGKVLRANYTDGDWDEFRVIALDTERGQSGVIGLIECEGIRFDLKRRAGLFERLEVDGYADFSYQLNGLTPEQWVDEILLAPDMPAYFSKGTISPTTVQTIPVATDTPYSALEELRELADAVDGPVDLDIRRNGTTDYKIDLTEKGSSAEKAFIHGLKNLTAVRHRASSVEQVTRCYPVGGSADDSITMGDNRWTIAATATTTVDLTADAIADPVRYADEFNNMYLERVSDGANKQITDTVVANNRLTVGASHGFSASDEVSIRRDASLNQLTYVEHPTSKTTYGLMVGTVERPDYPAVNNLCSSDIAFLSGTYTGGVANGWNAIGSPTLTEETASFYIKHGTKSQKVVAADTEGVITDAITVTPTTARPYLTAQAYIIVTALGAGAVVRFQLEDVTNTVEYPADDITSAYTDELNRWTRIDISPGVNLQAASTTSVKLKVWADGGTATFFVDAVQLSDRTRPPEEIVNGRVANALLHAAHDTLDEYNLPLDAVDVGLIDLNRVDDATWPNDEIVLGGTVTVVDPDVSLDLEARIIEVRRDLLNPGNTQIMVSERPADLQGLIGKKVRRRVRDLAPPTGNSFLPPVNLDLDGVQDGSTYVRVGNVDANHAVTTEAIDDNMLTLITILT